VRIVVEGAKLSPKRRTWREVEPPSA